MRYFIDTEFIEGFNEPLFGKKRHFIDLVSIGIVCEDGRTYSAISNEYRYKDADDWVRENVIIPLYSSTVFGDARNRFDSTNFQYYFGKSNKQIAKEVLAFINPATEGLNSNSWNAHLNKYNVIATENRPMEFYGYYADYDWVLLCSLFGRMIDLPDGCPMHCIDLKQMLDEVAEEYVSKNLKIPIVSSDWYKDYCIDELKRHQDYPKQSNEHNALADAKWNQDLYKFIQKIKTT